MGNVWRYLKKTVMYLAVVSMVLCGCGRMDRDGEVVINPDSQELMGVDFSDTSAQKGEKPAKKAKSSKAGTLIDTLPKAKISEGYYYGTLGSEDRQLYNEILSGLRAVDTADLSQTDQDRVDVLFQYVCADHPEIFYTDGYDITWKEILGKKTHMQLTGKYTYSKDEIETIMGKIEKERDKILKNMPAYQDDYGRVRYIHDYIATHTSYDTGAKDNQSIVSVLLYQKSICAGYARTMQYLLNEAGIPCAYVWGNADGNTGRGIMTHAWNLVQADGDWYYLDVTFDDPSVSLDSGKDNFVKYDYFLITAKELQATHTIDSSLELPDCTATRDNYYIREGRILGGYDKDRIREMFLEASAKGERYIIFRCESSGVFEMCRYKLIDEQEIFDMIGKRKSVSYSFDQEKLSMLFWL
ncbi:MAG: hypothetical protein K5739_08560 [Lachnospiraceae bacterium]|nr:hypothetical protein [Lachnospiraceae bacterium]